MPRSERLLSRGAHVGERLAALRRSWWLKEVQVNIRAGFRGTDGSVWRSNDALLATAAHVFGFGGRDCRAELLSDNR